MRRVVIIGYGMAGSRLAEGIRRRDPWGERVFLTVVGDEKHPPYNRTLLSTVVGGLPVDAVALPDNGVGLRLGAVALDRSTRTVVLADGSTVDFDVAVLATGARPWLPPVEGLTGPHVTVYRTLDDCVRVRDIARTGAPVAVLGGGLLGIEVACVLAERGNPVTIVHPAGHLMDRQLDSGAAAVLARTLARLGIEVLVGCSATRYEPGRLELITGDRVRAAHVVVTAGVRPETVLARHAGLAVDRGVLVDDTLRSTYPRVHAIGDCAQHPGAAAGHVRPAWEQADVLADLLTETDPAARYHGTPTVARLNARDIDLVALGETVRVSTDALCLTESSHDHYTKLVVRDGRVTGAIVLGAPEVAATVTRFHEQGLPVTPDLRALLLGGAPARRWETADI